MCSLACRKRGGRHVGQQGDLSNPFLASFIGRKLSLKGVVENIMLVKEKVKEKLRLLGTPGSWNHITKQSGTHGYLGLNCKFQNGVTLPFLTSDLCLNMEQPWLADQSATLLWAFLPPLDKWGGCRELYGLPTNDDTSYPIILPGLERKSESCDCHRPAGGVLD